MFSIAKKVAKKVLPSPVYNLLKKTHNKIYFNSIFYYKTLFGLPLKKIQDKITFTIRLVEHCNLNCAGCDNFSPLAEPEFLSIEEFRRDFERVGELFNHECRLIKLSGGEALLRPDILDFVKIARENFTKGTIEIYSNGILVPQQDDNFWSTLQKYKVGIGITDYPIKIDRDKIAAKAKEFNVNVHGMGDGRLKTSEFVKRPIDLAGNGDIRKNFFRCYRAYACAMLDHGRFYKCSFAPSIKHFNKFFNKNIPLKKDDYIDIYEVKSGEEILKRLAEPIPMCKYCDLDFQTIKWGVSERKISEWV